MAVLVGYKGSVKVQTGSAAFSNVSMNQSGPLDRTTYQISDPVRENWNSAGGAFNFQSSIDGGTTWVNQTPDKVQYLGGTIVFNTPRSSGLIWRCTGFYFTMVEAGGFQKWTADIETELLDITTLNVAGGARVYLPGLQTANITTEKFWVDGYFWTKLTGGAAVVLNLFLDVAGNNYYAMWTNASKVDVAVDVAGVTMSNPDLFVNGEMYYYTS